VATGVGHFCTAPGSVVPVWCVLVPWYFSGVTALLLASVPTGVGQDEDPLPFVGSSGIVRSHTTPLRIEPQRGQVTEDDVESPNSERCDVFHEDELGSHLANDASEVSPESAAVSLDSFPLAGVGDVLTGESASDAIHEATPRSAVEGGNVVPDRSRCQGLLFHPGHESSRGVGFPLDVHHSTTSGDGELDAEIEPSASGEEGENAEGTKSHIQAAPSMRTRFRSAASPSIRLRREDDVVGIEVDHHRLAAEPERYGGNGAAAAERI
jgi:hypothetical protein